MRLAALLLVLAAMSRCAALPALSDERLVLQTTLGDIELAFYPEVAPVTVKHILELGRLGAYNTNHFFRVDKGFVAQARSLRHAAGFGPLRRSRARRGSRSTPQTQVADVVGGRSAPLSELQARRRGARRMSALDDSPGSRRARVPAAPRGREDRARRV